MQKVNADNPYVTAQCVTKLYPGPWLNASYNVPPDLSSLADDAQTYSDQDLDLRMAKDGASHERHSSFDDGECYLRSNMYSI